MQPLGARRVLVNWRQRRDLECREGCGEKQLLEGMATVDAALKDSAQKVADMEGAIRKMRAAEAREASKLRLFYHYHCRTVILKQPHLQQRHRKHHIGFKTAEAPVFVMANSVRQHPDTAAFNRRHGITQTPLIEVQRGDPRAAAQSQSNARRAAECLRRRETREYATWLADQKAASAEFRRTRKVTHSFY